MKKTLLFVTYGGGHAHMVYPVVHALRKTGAPLTIHVLGLPAAKHTLKSNGIDCLGFNDFLDPEQDADALEWGRRLAVEHHSPTIGIDLEDSIAYLGLCYKDLVTRLGAAQAEEMFAKRVRHAFYPLTIMARVFDRLKPDFVVTSNSPRTEAAAIATANARGIDNLAMTDLFTGLGDYPLKARNITFINEFARDKFKSDALVDETISDFYYTGNPAFDKLLTLPKEKDPGWVKTHFPEAAGHNTLVLHADMSGWWHAPKKMSYMKSDTEILEELDAVYGAARENGLFYLIRPHPSQERGIYHRWLDGRSGAALAADCNLHDLLRNIDLLVSRTTTVGLEACYLQKRIVQLDAYFHADLPLARMGVAWGVNSYKELAATMKNALADDKKFEEIKNRVKQVFPAEPAADKIAKLILEKVA